MSSQTSNDEINWMAGGPQGSGVDTAANIFSMACGLGGLYTYGRREYHSNIKGKHSYFHLRVSPHEVMANVNDVDLLAAFDAETVVTHMREVVPGGLIVVDKDKMDIDVFGIPTLPSEFKDELREYLDEMKWGYNLKEILEGACSKRINNFPVSYSELLSNIATKTGVDPAKAMRMTNVVTIGVSFGLLGYDLSLVEEAVRKSFSDKPNVIDMNLTALRTSYDYVKENFRGELGFKLKRVEANEERVFVQGHQSVALGKIWGGCRFQAYYPITPASDESEYLEAHDIFETVDGEGSIVVLQAEDEIAAINLANGAALTGARASTSTSGPGFSLMAEGLGWAGNNEVPIVITHYQRGAPSTGLPTRHGQDDLRFAIHASHGEFARVVLASGDIRECFYDAANAFNIAERYQLPVIHLVDKALANSYQTFGMYDLSGYHIERGETLDETQLNGQEYRRFKLTANGISPRAFLGTKGGVQWYTGDEHNEFGHISEHPSMRTKMVEKRMRKLDLIDREIPPGDRINHYGDKKAENIVVSWGSCKGAILESLNRLTEEGFNLGFLQLRMMHPFPDSYVSEILRDVRRIIDVEMNYSGQLGEIIREKTGIPVTHRILKYNGRPMTTTEVYGAMKNVLIGSGPERQVLMHGA